MCYDEGVLQEVLDGEYQGDILEIHRHLNGCTTCRQLYETLKSQELLMKNALHLGYEEKDSEIERTLTAIKNKKKRKRIPMKKIDWRIKTAAAAILCGAMIFTAPGAALADQFLSIFRTQDIQAVAITPDDINDLSRLFEEGRGKVEIDKIGTFESVSQEEPENIEKMTDSAVLKGHMADVKVIPLNEGITYQNALLFPKTEMRFTLQVQPLNDLLKALGKESTFPEALDGKTFSITADRAVGYSIELKDKAATLHAMVSGMPAIGLPEGVDHKQLLGTLHETGLLPDGLTEKLSGLDNLETVLPIPYETERQTKTETVISGNPAVVIKDKENSWFTIFTKNGDYLYVFTGSEMTVDEAIKLIETQE